MEDRGASSVDDQVTDWLPTHGPVEAVGSLARLDGGQPRAARPSSARDGGKFLYNGVSSGIDAMVVDNGARGEVLTPPQSKSDVDTVFWKPQFSKFRGRKLGSSDEDCAPDELTYYGNRDTGSEFGSLSSLDDEIPKEVERRLPPPFSAGYDRVLMRERDACSPPALDASFRLNTQLAMPVARKLSPDFEALSLDDRLEMAEWALQVSRTGVGNKDDSWRSTTVNRSCDTTNSLNASVGPQSGDLFSSEESDDQPRQERPVPAPRVRKLMVPSLPVAAPPVPAPRVRKLAESECLVNRPRVRESVGRDNYRVVELQSAGRSEMIRPDSPDVMMRDYRDRYRSHDRDSSRSRESKKGRHRSPDDSLEEPRYSHRGSKRSEKRHRHRGSSSSSDDSVPVQRRKRRSSVTFRDDSADQKVFRRSHKDSMKVERYDGSASFEAFLAQFENCSKYNGWNSEDKLLQLKGALRGSAAQVLLGEDNATTFHDLCQELRQCFGTEGYENQFESQLKVRRRYRGETLRALYHDIQRLVLQAYPGTQNKLRDRLAVEAFITSLNDKDLELRVRDRCPTNLPECFRTAMMLESNQLIVQGPDNVREKRRLAERTDIHARVIDSNEAALREMADRVQDSQSYQANMVESDDHRSKEIALEQRIKELEQMVQQIKEEKFTQQVNTLGNNLFQRNEQKYSPPVVNRPRQPIVCFKCGQSGHVMASCQSIPQRPRPTCFLCGQAGHLQAFCQNKRTFEGSPGYQASIVKLAAQSVTEKPDLRGHVYLDMKLNGQDQRFLLDSGCDVTLFPASCVRSNQLKPTEKKVKAANGTEIALLGEVEVILQIEHLQIPTFALVTENIAEPLIGYDWLAQNQVFWGFGVGKIIIQDEIFSLIESPDEILLCTVDSANPLNEEIPEEIQRYLSLPLITECPPPVLELLLSSGNCLSDEDSKSVVDSLRLLDGDIPDEIKMCLPLPLSTTVFREEKMDSLTAPESPDFRGCSDAGFQGRIDSRRFVVVNQCCSMTSDVDHSVRCLFECKRRKNNQFKDRCGPAPWALKLDPSGGSRRVKGSLFVGESERLRQRFRRKVRKKVGADKSAWKVRKKWLVTFQSPQDVLIKWSSTRFDSDRSVSLVQLR